MSEKKKFRAEKKHYFQLEYETILNVLNSDLTNEELAEYFKAVCNYELYGEEPGKFSDRVIKSLFVQTARELDYQLEKHKARQMKGYINYWQDKTIVSLLSDEQYNLLDEEIPGFSELIKEIDKQLQGSNKEVKSPVNYIRRYADKTNWKQRMEEEIERIATVSFNR